MLGRVYLARAEYEPAVEECRVGIRLNPSMALGHYMLGHALLLAGEPEAAISSFQAAARTLLKERTPGIELVGDELIVPFGKVQDFTPYIAKIKASGADTILTGNWGPDLVRLVKFAAGANLPAQFYTIYGGLTSSVAG